MKKQASSKMVICTLWVLSWLLVLQSGSAFAQGELLVTVKAVKASFVLAEPVYVDVEMKNVSNDVLGVSEDPLKIGALIRIVPPEGRGPGVWSRAGDFLGRTPLLNLSAGHWLKDRAQVSHDGLIYNFPVSGTYRVWAEYGEGSLKAVSQPVEVLVREPEARDAEAVALFSSEEDRYFIRYGGYGAVKGHGITPAVGDFERIVSEFPTSTYAPYAAYYLALAKSQPQQYSLGPGQVSEPILPDCARAIELAHFAEARADFPLKGEARLLQAECYFGQGDRTKASAVLQSIGSLPGLSERKRAEALMGKMVQPAQ